MLIGLGELVAGIRSLNFARVLAGAVTLLGDTSAYLSINTAFRNYIIEKYPNDHEKILTIMFLGGAVLSLGGTSVISSGILKTYSATEAAEFIGIGQAVLEDADALSKLTTNERKILENGIVTFENGLYRIRYSVEDGKVVKRAKGIYKLYHRSQIRAKIVALEEIDKFNALEVFPNLSKNLIEFLELHPEIIDIWKNLDDIGKRLLSEEENF
ncbi:hypothetical protein [Pedobacter sp. MW01-1-1]|uniref:hypothetical protein n=1 Tax=Pedobacter sp. MW01-1-1 TaxID=3383027 RepID=UPI003FEEB562